MFTRGYHPVENSADTEIPAQTSHKNGFEQSRENSDWDEGGRGDSNQRPAAAVLTTVRQAPVLGTGESEHTAAKRLPVRAPCERKRAPRCVPCPTACCASTRVPALWCTEAKSRVPDQKRSTRNITLTLRTFLPVLPQSPQLHHLSGEVQQRRDHK
ncbi:MAG: hypothetical protein G01um1014106_312 [Parcubacteria group bacterium Gr01-1014_106]|nr:MAG: hypothetical protein G01um1014106_312 [Parcubacteria group bacterium Gr01-1014_106]